MSSNIVSYLASLGVWNWFILAGVLLAIEVMVPGTFFLWLGLSAALVGGLSFVIAWSWQLQLVAFAVLALVSFVVWWRFGRPSETAPDRPFLNRRSEGFVGRVFTLDKPIVDGSGTVRIDDTIWRVAGPDCPAGSRVKVARADAATLVVEPAA
ncbi:MAG: inner membrane protein [Hyphomicrobiales bacterium]|jgi:membrane protein implicated in regulation of membrane protease activity|nr:inner membrane protein [Hyphomicrobiales bacterium]